MGNTLNKRGDYRTPGKGGEKAERERESGSKEGNTRSRNKSKNIGLPMLQETRHKA